MSRPMTENGFNARTAKIVKTYAKTSAWVWLNSLTRCEAEALNIGGGLVRDTEDAAYYAFFNAMPEVGGYTIPTYNQDTLAMFEASIEAYDEELQRAYANR